MYALGCDTMTFFGNPKQYGKSWKCSQQKLIDIIFQKNTKRLKHKLDIEILVNIAIKG